MFLLIISLAELFLIAVHSLVYTCFVLFLGIHSIKLIVSLRIIFGFFSIAFLGGTILTRYFNNFLSRIFYTIVAFWMGLFVYLLFASFILSILYFFMSGQTFVLISQVVYSLAVLIALYGVLNAQNSKVTRVNVALPNLPHYWNGKKAVFLSDTHFGQVRNRGFAKRLSKIISNEDPEIVLYGGDFYDGVITYYKELAEIIASSKSVQGVYMVLGNHEHFEDSTVYEIPLQEGGIKVMKDEIVNIEGLQIIGIDYLSAETKDNYIKTVQNISYDKDKPSIMLRHVPHFIKETKDLGISLQLSGHTHRGQLWPFRYLTKRLFEGFDYGLKSLENLLVYTSSGAGTWGPPLRVFTKAEIVSITFNKKYGIL